MDKAIRYAGIIAVALVLVLAAAGAYVFFISRAPAPPDTATTTPGTGLFGSPSPVSSNTKPANGQTSAPAPAGERVSIINRDGATVSVKAFLPDANATSTRSVDATGPSPVIPLYWPEEKGLFSIVYNSNNNFFGVTLLEEPIGEARLQAEAYLIRLLDIPAPDACRLNYTVGVSASLNPIYSGKNLGFSFCPGAVKL